MLKLYDEEKKKILEIAEKIAKYDIRLIDETVCLLMNSMINTECSEDTYALFYDIIALLANISLVSERYTGGHANEKQTDL